MIEFIKTYCILITLCIIVCTYFFKKTPKIKFPFKNIIDEFGNNTNIISIIAPFRNKEHYHIYERYKDMGYKFIGISSYINFPNEIKNPYDPAKDEKMSWYIDKCIAWLHCFKKPKEIFLKYKVPYMLISESDFTNPTNIVPTKIAKKWDFIYVCLDHGSKKCNGWSASNKNWDLAKKCFKIMCTKYKLKGLIIGRKHCYIDPNIKKYLTIIDFLPYHEFLKKIQQTKFMFVPNILDASPRIITQSLCLNIPILVNKNIIGGWKYVNKQTGEFFNDETDIEISLSNILKKKYSPRKYFKKHYGPQKYGKKLSLFLKKIYPSFTNCKLAIP